MTKWSFPTHGLTKLVEEISQVMFWLYTFVFQVVCECSIHSWHRVELWCFPIPERMVS